MLEIMPDINSCSSTSQYTRYLFNVSELDNNFEGPSDLAVFMLRFIGFKPKDKLKYNKSIEAKGFLIQSWLYSYSKPKLDKALDFFEFRVLFQYVYYCCIESILKEDSALSKKWRSILRHSKDLIIKYFQDLWTLWSIVMLNFSCNKMY